MKKIVFLFLLFTLHAEATSWKYFSMNLHCGLGDWKSRVDQVIGHILNSDPDVIGLQEICFNDDMNMTNYIIQELSNGGYPISFWETKKTHKSFVKYEEELLIITKHSVKSSKSGDLPSVKFFENKYLAIELEDHWIVTTHLHFALPQVRKSQYKKLASLFSEKRAILLGDLNSNPKDSETLPLKEKRWVSYFGGPTYPSEAPKSTFDGFWITGSLDHEVLNTKFSIVFEGNPTPPSDHLGVELMVHYR